MSGQTWQGAVLDGTQVVLDRIDRISELVAAGAIEQVIETPDGPVTLADVQQAFERVLAPLRVEMQDIQQDAEARGVFR